MHSVTTIPLNSALGAVCCAGSLLIRLQVALRLRGSVSSKQIGYEDLLAPLIAEACIDVVPTNPHNFNVDNVRIVKILGG